LHWNSPVCSMCASRLLPDYMLSEGDGVARVTRKGLLAIMLALVALGMSAGIAGASHTRWGIPNGKLGWLFDPPNHYGEDVKQSPGTLIRALHSGCVYRVKDHDRVSGYHQEVTVRYNAKGSMGRRWVLYGHVKEGSMRKKGSCFKRGAILARVGTKSDGYGTAHAHVQIWKSEYAARYYKNGAAINPAPVRRKYGEL
jgi:murein DD-endopeptidase MepM/ murein hydrolase activator NlpD